MGMYDMLPRGGQVKCWECELNTYRVGDIVSVLYPKYIVLLQEGGYVKVEDGKIVKIVENKGRKYYYPEDFPNIPCIDKWGRLVQSKDNMPTGMFNSPYYDTGEVK